MTKNAFKSTNIFMLTALPLLFLTACGDNNGGDEALADDCTPEHEGITTFTEGVLTVGVPENMPWTENEGQDARGVEIEILKRAAEAQCLQLEYVNITYGNGIPMITEQQQTDIISGGWYITEERAEQVGFTVPAYYDAMGIVSQEGITTVDELEEIGSVGSGAGFAWESEMQEVLGNDMQNYPGTVEMAQDLEAGRLQAALDGYSVAAYYYENTDFEVHIAEEDDRISVTSEMPVAAFPVDPDNQELADALSDLINEYREDGTLADILSEYDLSEDLVVPADAAEEARP